ncbi:menaquinone biosynthesis family protein [Olivibacter domesticus]|uniref:1,4-dihydroxy-6-naphtoate synthase n=1 Tax=Olivibacter domesticus TaxID=407022 RepID=A0A1H7S756_OLID1|nr:1,4-dihydroxy-6-naphthoate synthase [Olivibacter domesticus]SEL67347.1 1,4-dihydroxy-6-naphthoate synthase [Olivibacter domesticus]
MKLTLGFSPCPNDTFIFDAMIHQKIDTEGLSFDVSYEDVETLNQKTFNEELDISKLSFHAYAYTIENYVLLDAGSALGFGVGPLLICKNKEILEATLKSREEDINLGLRVAIPGEYTTANFLLGLAFPKLQNKVLKVFSEIEPALLNNEVDLGLIIHENRFTYQDKGLIKVMDLGDFWEKETGCPIPLGGIVIRRNLSDEVKAKVNRVLKKSVEYAFKHPKSGIDFIRKHAQEMSEEVMYKHIGLYVNKYSIDLGEEGKQAVQVLFEKALSLNLIPSTKKSLFLDRTNIDELKNH